MSRIIKSLIQCANRCTHVVLVGFWVRTHISGKGIYILETQIGSQSLDDLSALERNRISQRDILDGQVACII